MKQYGLRYLYKHLGEALKELPFAITNHNKVVAVVHAVAEVYGSPQIVGDMNIVTRKEDLWTKKKEKVDEFTGNVV